MDIHTPQIRIISRCIAFQISNQFRCLIIGKSFGRKISRQIHHLLYRRIIPPYHTGIIADSAVICRIDGQDQRIFLVFHKKVLHGKHSFYTILHGFPVIHAGTLN